MGTYYLQLLSHTPNEMSKVENVVNILGQAAVYQISSKKRARTDEEKKELAVKIEASCRRFNNNHGSLSIDEFYNVIKLQNGVEVSKDELRRLSADLDMDKNFKISIKDFMTVPLISSEVFMTLDKNKDGFISRRELKLAHRNLTRAELDAVIGQADADGDGKLTFEEIKQIADRNYYLPMYFIFCGWTPRFSWRSIVIR